MKQNERLLIYAVTGFLALILVVAVVFGRAPADGSTPNGAGKSVGTPSTAQGLGDLLGSKTPANGGKPAGESANSDGNDSQPSAGGNAATDGASGLPTPDQLANQNRLAGGGQPLVAQAKPLVAAELVAQELGASRRDRNVRFVRAIKGDSLELLVQRWCGAREPFLAEARSLNEELTTLQVGQEVAVPFVEDEALLAVIEARRPKVTVPTGAALETPSGSGTPSASPLSEMFPSLNGQPRNPAPAPADALGLANNRSAVPASATVGTTYTVKAGDSLWKIAERHYGKGGAARMIPLIKQANPTLTDTLRIGQKIQLPKAPAAASGA